MKKNKNIEKNWENYNVKYKDLKFLVEKILPILEGLLENQKILSESLLNHGKALFKIYKQTFFSLIFLIFFLKYVDLIVKPIIYFFGYVWNLYSKSSVDTQILVITGIFSGIIGGTIVYLKEKISKK